MQKSCKRKKHKKINIKKTCRFNGKDLLTKGTEIDIEAFEDDLRNYMYVNGGYLKEPSPRLLTTEYAEKVVDGIFTASKRHIKACERHLFDLSRIDDPWFPWRFDEDLAFRAIRAMEAQLNPTKKKGYHLLYQPNEHFKIGCEYGWVSKKNPKKRRFTDALEFIARKNWKTTSAAARAIYMASGMNESVPPQCVFVGTTEKQAAIGFKMASQMIDNGYGLKGYKMNKEVIEKNDAEIWAATAEAKTKDGLNPLYVVFDEIHAYTSTEQMDVYMSGRNSRMDNSPLFVYCTSGGYVEDGPLATYLEMADECFEDFSNPTYDHWFYFINEMDSLNEIHDASLWIKANPNMCVSFSLGLLVASYRTAIKDPTSHTYKELITKNFNFFTRDEFGSYISTDVILQNDKVISRDKLKGKKAVIGYDLGNTEDFSSVVTLVELGDEFDGELYAEIMSFIPNARYKAFEDKEKLDKFIAEGSLVISGEDYTKYEDIVEYIKKQSFFLKLSNLDSTLDTLEESILSSKLSLISLYRLTKKLRCLRP